MTMTPMDKQRLLARFNGNPPADAASIQQFESESGLRLPEDYRQLLRHTDGGEGFVGNAYVILWRVGELLEMNRGYQVAEFAPGLLLIGSDGGGEALAFDMRTEAKPVVSVPFVGMSLKHTRLWGRTFGAFLECQFES